MYRTLPPPPERLLVFARLPELGRVKTRLAGALGNERALEVYRAMLRDLLAGMGTSTEEREIEVLWAPSEAASGETLRAAFGSHTLAMQTGATLGDRLAMAFSERFFFHRTHKIIAIGVDDPRLNRDIIDHAFGLLESCEWVVGPAADGGYYLIGCRAASYDTVVFTGVAWGSETVLRTTLEKIRGIGCTVAELPTRRDIDTAEDLEAYSRSEQWEPRAS